MNPMNAMDYDPDGKLSREKVAIVGVGGTGSHILDYVSKTPVDRIHVFDGGYFLPENAKRSPGPSESMLRRETKGDYHGGRYAERRPGVHGYGHKIDQSNVERLANYTTVFLCIDGGQIKRRIFEVCMENGVTLINVGMGISLADNGRLIGLLGVTTCLPWNHYHAEHCFALDDAATADPNATAHNWQLIELNALSAALAVIKWKKLLGIYDDYTTELDCQYALAANEIDNDFEVEE